MIITSDELAAIELALDVDRRFVQAMELAEIGRSDEPEGPSGLPVFFARAPHLLMALGFDEYVVLERDERDRRFRHAERYGLDSAPLVYPTESIYRARESGAWYVFDGLNTGEGVPVEELLFMGAASARRKFPLGNWLNEIARQVEAPDRATRALWLPSTWTPEVQRNHREALRKTVDPLLLALRDGSLDIRDLHWRELEELVAHLLAMRGLEVDVTSRGPDGGRDVIARGELVPGEPMQIAVEVKQKAVVGIGDVRRALRANEDFPALMIATAGRFSAGVVAEKGRTRNSLRLFLKDGVAISQWLGAT